jgi:hypothetical protein
VTAPFEFQYKISTSCYIVSAAHRLLHRPLEAPGTAWQDSAGQSRDLTAGSLLGQPDDLMSSPSPYCPFHQVSEVAPNAQAVTISDQQ